MDIAERIKIYRKYLGMTQETIAAKAGVNEKYYGRIERGESCPTIDFVVKICNAMEIDIIELMLMEVGNGNKQFIRNPIVTNTIINGLKYDIDIHFNRDALFDGCDSSIWYNGFVGSMNFDEFELRIYAVGNVKGKLFIDGEEILDLNTDDAANELKKYVKNDAELRSLIEYMPYDQDILDEKHGNAFFVSETNWLIARLVNNNTGEIINDDIILDTDNIMESLSNKELLFDYIFGDKDKSKYSEDVDITKYRHLVRYAQGLGTDSD